MIARLIPVLDPVMGDDGALYVAKEVVPMYKSIIPFADIILPNQFEAELLTDLKLDSFESIVPCLEKLHSIYNVPHVVISSLSFESRPDVIYCCGSTLREDDKPRPFMLEVPIIHGVFVGTGDLFAALLLIRLHPFVDQLRPSDYVSAVDLPLAKALEFVIASMQEVLKNTKVAMDQQLARDGDMNSLSEKEKRVNIMRAAELRLVQSQGPLTHPHVKVRALPIENVR
jgi:pyridoxine kinase